MTVKEGLQKALELLGPNGENWCKGDEDHNISQFPGKFCAMTSLGAACGAKHAFYEARSILYQVCPIDAESGQVVSYNDFPETTFADIKSLFEKAIAAAE